MEDQYIVFELAYTAISSLLRWKRISVEVKAIKTPETLRIHGSGKKWKFGCSFLG